MQCGLVYAKPMIVNLREICDIELTSNLHRYVANIESRGSSYRRMLKRFDGYRKAGHFLEVG